MQHCGLCSKFKQDGRTPLRLPDASPLAPPELARLGLSRFVAFDCETTGLDARNDRVIELGAVLFEGGEPVAHFSELVKIDERLSPFISRLTGITDDDLATRPRIEDVLPEFIEFTASHPLVGHNIKFDLDFVDGELARISKADRPDWPHGPAYDTSIIARTFFPLLTGYGLGALSRTLEVPLEQAHRAVHDAEATGRLLVELLKRARRTPFGELQEMDRIIGGASFTLGELIQGLSAIGPGETGVDTPFSLRDNRIGYWEGENVLDPEPVEDEESFIAEFLSGDGPLSGQVKGWRERKGQVSMAQEVHATLKAGGHLLAEAGTGTGKSFAYLLPALLHARQTRDRVVVSTQTRHLQDQLFEKDLPALDAALGGGVRAVLLKGRSNYICKRRYDSLVADPDRLDPSDRQALLPLVRWLRRTVTGDISEVPAFKPAWARGLWSRISAESGFCSGRVCRGSQGCFLHKIRTSAQRSHVVLINHALLFADLSSGGGVLGEYDRVIFDEAHHIERVAADHLGLTWSAPGERIVLSNLYDPSGDKGVLVSLKAYSALLKTEVERGSSDADPLEKAIDAVKDALKSGEAVGAALSPLTSIDDGNGYGRRERYKSGDELFGEEAEAVSMHRKRLERLVRTLGDIIKEFEELETVLTEGDDLLGEFRRLVVEVGGLLDQFVRLTGEGEENTVFWFEVQRSGNRQNVVLRGAPLDVGKVLNDKLYPKLTGAIFTSATLTVAESFDYIASRLGIPEARGQIYPSPFELNSQLMICVAGFLGNPKQNTDDFATNIGEMVSRLPEELDTGTLVLFTSQRMLRQVWDQAAPVLERDGWLTLAQGVSGAQTELLDRFRKERKSVLFGVDSFWEGIDVPGQSLELSIIARLPFAVPTDPLVQARSEKIEREGGNSFMQYSLPEATLRLRQGIGRLIRTTEDVGVAVICDPRILHSRWGKVIANSLPVAPMEYSDYASLLRDTKKFLAGPA